MRACVTAKKTHSVFPEGTESSPSTQQHRPWCDCGPACRQEWGTSREAAALSWGTRHGPAPATGRGCLEGRRVNPEVFARVSAVGRPGPGLWLPEGGLPSQPHLLGRLGAPFLLGGWGPSGVSLGIHPGLGVQASCSPHRAQAEAPGRSRSLPQPEVGGTEPAQPLPRFPGRGGAAGTRLSAGSCFGSSGSAEPLPFLGKVELGLPHGRPAGRHLTCQKGRKEHH